MLAGAAHYAPTEDPESIALSAPPSGIETVDFLLEGLATADCCLI
jgi:hypothetical protein